MNEATVRAIVAVQKIEADLSDRRGLGQEWDQIDEDIKEEIRAKWQSIILSAIHGASTNA